MQNKIPENPQRIMLINPTRYLGNLLVAGGLIQSFSDWCIAHDKTFCVVLDESFATLCRDAFARVHVIWYPRSRIQQGSILEKLRLYQGVLREIHQFNADLAFNIEEETAVSRLTQLSRAGFRLGCSTRKHSRGYDGVLPIQYENRAAECEHRWHSYADVFTALGMPKTAPGYLRFVDTPMNDDLRKTLSQSGIDFSRPVIAIHAGATKDYKKYPVGNFAALCKLIQLQGWQAVLIGAGDDDAQTNRNILVAVGATHTGLFNLCNQLDLPSLKALFGCCNYIVGNDSGPSHLASALGVPGTVIFGPTDAEIWRPLGAQTRLIQNTEACASDCSKSQCALNRLCLQQIPAARIFQQASESIPA